jgi:hypothetical protein
MPTYACDAACGTEREASWWQRHRPANHAVRRLYRYTISQKKSKRIEECFGWMKDIALLRKLKRRGLSKAGWIFSFAAAAYNLVRLRKLTSVAVAA